MEVITIWHGCSLVAFIVRDHQTVGTACAYFSWVKQQFRDDTAHAAAENASALDSLSVAHTALEPKLGQNKSRLKNECISIS